jgi:hypothetical protein
VNHGAFNTYTAEQVRDALAQLSDPNGDTILTGPDEFAKALAAFDQGKSINYMGATGPVDYDANGRVKLEAVSHYKGNSNGDFDNLGLFDCPEAAACTMRK